MLGRQHYLKKMLEDASFWLSCVVVCYYTSTTPGIGGTAHKHMNTFKINPYIALFFPPLKVMLR